MHHVEILGPSGAGKTTLRNNILNMIPDSIGGQSGIYQCGKRASKFTLLFDLWPNKLQSLFIKKYILPRCYKSFIEKNQKFLLVREKLIEISPGRNMEPQLTRVVAEHNLMTEFSSDEVVIIDDGIYQFHLHLVEHNEIEKGLSHYLPLPDVLVVVNALPKACMKRQRNRERGYASAFEGRSWEESIERLQSMRKATRCVATDLEAQGVPVVRVSTMQEPDQVATEVVEKLSQIMDCGKMVIEND